MLEDVIADCVFLLEDDEEPDYGLEYYLDKDGNLQVKQNKLTKKRIYEDDIDIESEIGDSKKGSDIYLTIDSEIQFIAEEELARMVEKVHAKWGGVVIMEPYSGKILAMANYPTYEPERYREYPIENKRNFMDDLRSKNLLSEYGTVCGKTMHNVITGYSF